MPSVCSLQNMCDSGQGGSSRARLDWPSLKMIKNKGCKMLKTDKHIGNLFLGTNFSGAIIQMWCFSKYFQQRDGASWTESNVTPVFVCSC